MHVVLIRAIAAAVALPVTFLAIPAQQAAARGTSAPIRVPADFATIQAAVDAAAPGATIDVAPGNYTEQLVMTKDLRLRGSGAGATVIDAPAVLAPFGTHLLAQRPVAAVVRVGAGAHVQLTGVGVRGPLPCGLVTGVLATQGATLDFTDSEVTDMVPAGACTQPPSDRGVVFGLPPFIHIDGTSGSNAFGRVARVRVAGYLTEALTATGRYQGVPTSVTFDDNVVLAGAPALATEQFAVNVLFGAVARITGNTVAGAVCTFDGCGPDPITEFQSAGIFAAGAGSRTTIVGNHVSDTDIGIYQVQSPRCCRISDNLLTDNRFFGIVIQDGDGATSDNTISGGRSGIGVVADAVDTTAWLRGDSISGTSELPVRELECCGFTATAVRAA